MRTNRAAITKILLQILIILGLSMIPPLGIAVFRGETDMIRIFIGLILLFLAIGILGNIKIGNPNSNLRMRDGFFLVGLTWFMSSLLGALPYTFSGILPNFADALFESTAAFTTTGASIIPTPEKLPHSLLFWRSFSQWLGGMGILVFIISVLPALGISGQQIAKAETTGPAMDKFTPKMTDSAKLLYIIYTMFTITCIILLRISGLNWFDSFIHAFASVSTGGLSCYSTGISHFSNLAAERIVTVFAIFSSINFTLYYSLSRKQWKSVLQNRELQTFAGLLVGASVLITVSLLLHHTYTALPSALHDAFFQATSFMTSTGHFNTNFDLWPPFCKGILFVLMVTGACSASTCGGLKLIRVIVLFRVFTTGLKKLLHPRAIIPVKIHGSVIPEETVFAIFVYFFLYLFTLFGSALILAFQQIDLMSALSAASATLNNTGTGFGLVGPSGNFSFFSPGFKIYLSFLMLAGRLEIYAILFLFMPAFWKPARR